MYLSRLAYAPIPCGPAAGVYTLRCRFESGEKESLQEDLIPLIQEALENTRQNSIEIDTRGMKLDDPGHLDLQQMIGTWRDRNYGVRAVAPGGYRPLWWDHVSWQVAWLKNPEWVGYAANEIVYAPGEVKDLSAPFIPTTSQALTTLYLTHRLPPAEVISFLYAQAPRRWAVITETQPYAVEYSLEVK